MTLTAFWHDVVLIANPVNMVYSNHSVLYYTFRLSKSVFSPGRIRNSFPPLPYFGQTLFPPLSNLLFVCSPLKIHFPPTHRKNDRCLMQCLTVRLQRCQHSKDLGALRHGSQRSLKYLICIFENQIIPCFTIFRIMYLFKTL